MTDTPKDPMKQRPGTGAQPSKRPAATIDLQATEIERRDIPRADEAGTTDQEKMASAPPEAAEPKVDTAGAAKPEAEAPAGATTGSARAAEAKPSPRPAASPPAKIAGRPSAAAAFVSHLLAGVAGAALAIFGADYAANTFGLSIPTYSSGQVEQLARRMGALEQDSKERSGDAAANLLREQLLALQVKVEQTAGATAVVDSLQTQQKQLLDRAAKVDQLLASQPAMQDVNGRVGKLEDQFKMMAQSGAAGKGGDAGQMAALVAKVDSIGINLDAHLGDMRKSLLGDLQKQSAHFEDRLAEIDKGMSVETIKASSKTLSDEIVGLKAGAEKIRQDIATVATGNQQLREDLATLQATTTAIKAQVQTQASTFAKTDELTNVNAAATKLQTDLAAIAARDQSREQSANRILLTLELSNLKRAIERGGSYARELASVQKLAPKDMNLSGLQGSAEQGLPTNAALANEFKDLSWGIVNAGSKPADDGSLLGQLWQGARSVVQVRKTGEVGGDSTEAVVARAEARLQTGDLDGTLREAGQLTGDARKAAQAWMAKLAARLAVDQGIADIEANLVKVMAPAATN